MKRSSGPRETCNPKPFFRIIIVPAYVFLNWMICFTSMFLNAVSADPDADPDAVAIASLTKISDHLLKYRLLRTNEGLARE